MLDVLKIDYCPPAPRPPERRLGFLELLTTLARNPIECWSAEFFQEPIAKVGLPFVEAVLVHEPAAIKRVLLDNAGNYRKDPIQRRILSNGLEDGLLSVEGPRWEVQRRALAPLFAKRTVNSFAQSMLVAANELAANWQRLGPDAVIDAAAEMGLVTLNVLALTIFSDGIGEDAEGFRLAMNAYFGGIGKIGALDLLGVPAWVPRPGQARVSRAMAYFEGVIDDLIEARRRRLADAPPGRAPEDLLTLLLRALDPSTGQRMSLAEVRSNILTFLSAGHETTANTLAWSLFLLSQSPQWRSQIQEEVDRELGAREEGLADRLVVTRAVLEEALRLYPPIAALSRQAVESDDLGNIPVKRGSLIVISPYVLHRHRLWWDRPDVFDPSRSHGRQAKRDWALCLHAVWYWIPDLHWRRLRSAGGDHHPRHADASFRSGSAAGCGGLAGTTRDPAAEHAADAVIPASCGMSREQRGSRLRIELGVPIEIIEPAIVQIVRREQSAVAMQLMHGRREG